MPSTRDDYGEDSSEDDFDPEGPSPEEMDSSDDPDLDVCPHCRKLISEEAEQCPHCHEYLSPHDAPMTTPAWIVFGALVALLVMLLVWIF